MNLVSIVIPVYNEEEAIGDDLALILNTMKDSGYDYEIIVVNDGSTDRTAEIVRGFEEVRMIQHPYNRGTGAARTTGLRVANGDVVVMTDGDGTYPNQDIPRLLAEMEANGWDMVVGARLREAGTVRWLRSPTKWFIRMLASYLTATKIPDLNSGFRAFKRDVALRFVSVLPNTHSWVSTITIAFLTNGHPVKYVPIDYYRRRGKSSFHPISDTYNYLSLVVRSIMYFNPLKIFLPASLGLLLMGIGKAIYDIFAYNWHFAPSTLILVLTAVQLGALGLLADLVVKRMPLQ